MSVNEEEAATSAPADVILLEGGEKGKDEKIKYTSLMETTLLSVVTDPTLSAVGDLKSSYFAQAAA